MRDSAGLSRKVHGETTLFFSGIEPVMHDLYKMILNCNHMILQAFSDRLDFVHQNIFLLNFENLLMVAHGHSV